jgi:hypothetical protein
MKCRTKRRRLSALARLSLNADDGMCFTLVGHWRWRWMLIREGRSVTDRA